MAERERPEPSLMHNIGAFFGHIVQAIREDPTKPGADSSGGQQAREAPGTAGSSPTDGRGEGRPDERLEVRREVQEAQHGEYLLRRTTIDEVIRAPDRAKDPADETGNAKGDATGQP